MSTPPEAPGGALARVTFRDVFAIQEYRALWCAQLLSLLGDQLALVALTWLVYERSGSALLTAGAYAVSLLPWVIGGPLLSGLADRYPRREVMVVSDLGRAGLMLVMALPGTPLWALYCLLFGSTLLASPFSAARAALLPDILPGERYVVGTAIGNITIQAGQVGGYAVGGLLVALLQPSVALGLNAGTFLVSALLLGSRLRRRAAARVASARRSIMPDAVAGIRLVWTDPTLRALTGLALLCSFYVVAEGMAVFYAGLLGAGPVAAGLLLAAGPAGAVIGSVVLARWVPPRRRLRLMGPMAAAACATLIPYAAEPGLAIAAVLLALSGAASAYQLAANAAFVSAVPAALRGQAFGLVQALMYVGQGVAIALAGACAQVWSAGTVIAAAGVLGCSAAALAGWAWRKTFHPSFG